MTLLISTHGFHRSSLDENNLFLSICTLFFTATPITMATSQYVTFDTSVGSFTVELYTQQAPKVSSCIRIQC